MKKDKLPDKVQRILKGMQDGKRALHMPYMGRFNPNEYYDLEGVGKCTREMKKLISLGYVEHNHKNVSLTEKGKNFKCELDEPYDVWVVDSSYNVEVNKYLGFVKGSTMTLDSGESSKENNNKKFFTDREKAFQYAKKLQCNIISGLKGKVKWEEEKLSELDKQEENPEEDKPGYL